MDQVWIPSHPFLLALAFLHFPPQRCHQIRVGKVKPVAQVTYCFRPPFPKTLVPLHAGKSTARIHKKIITKKTMLCFHLPPSQFHQLLPTAILTMTGPQEVVERA